MKIHELPDYYIANNIDYVRHRNKAIETGNLTTLINSWRFIFENSYSKVKKYILSNNFDHQEVLKLMRQELKISNGKITQGIISRNKRIAIELLCPTILLQAILLAEKFGVPQYTALHQGFCKEEDHENCF